ncbi:hypothetical protein FIBSPDRAFT_359207 [Athelia psychrophila]|uniref:Uncharacterized protein n=1 Tax=Athelia psychrophila TaxID=1759441 RepID=A0A166PMI1_9AGAM|nr:hypothetical protein FIBSPDRAFT_359207 [Fibularhizoctonia sp. CBS 109695]
MHHTNRSKTPYPVFWMSCRAPYASLEAAPNCSRRLCHKPASQKKLPGRTPAPPPPPMDPGLPGRPGPGTSRPEPWTRPIQTRTWLRNQAS